MRQRISLSAREVALGFCIAKNAIFDGFHKAAKILRHGPERAKEISSARSELEVEDLLIAFAGAVVGRRGMEERS